MGSPSASRSGRGARRPPGGSLWYPFHSMSECEGCLKCREREASLRRHLDDAEEKLRASYADLVMFGRAVEELLIQLERVKIVHTFLCHAEEGGVCDCSIVKLEERVRDVIAFLPRSRIGE